MTLTNTETLDQIASSIVNEWADAHQVTEVGPGTKARLVAAVLSALRNERERAIRIINDHQALDVFPLTSSSLRPVAQALYDKGCGHVMEAEEIEAILGNELAEAFTRIEKESHD